MATDYLEYRRKVDYAKSYLRRQYNSNPDSDPDLTGLKAYADTIWAAATDPVTLTSTGFEGGSQSGQITFEKPIIGIAVEELIQELDPNYTPPLRSRVIQPDWRFASPV